MLVIVFAMVGFAQSHAFEKKGAIFLQSIEILYIVLCACLLQLLY